MRKVEAAQRVENRGYGVAGNVPHTIAITALFPEDE